MRTKPIHMPLALVAVLLAQPARGDATAIVAVPEGERPAPVRGSPGSRDFYELLGVGPDADADTIHQAYRRLSRAHHADTGGSDDAMKLLNAAYTTLMDPVKRALYDETGRSAFDPQAAAAVGTSREDFFKAWGSDPATQEARLRKAGRRGKLRFLDQAERLAPSERETLHAVVRPLLADPDLDVRGRAAFFALLVDHADPGVLAALEAWVASGRVEGDRMAWVTRRGRSPGLRSKALEVAAARLRSRRPADEEEALRFYALAGSPETVPAESLPVDRLAEMLRDDSASGRGLRLAALQALAAVGAPPALFAPLSEVVQSLDEHAAMEVAWLIARNGWAPSGADPRTQKIWDAILFWGVHRDDRFPAFVSNLEKGLLDPAADDGTRLRALRLLERAGAPMPVGPELRTRLLSMAKSSDQALRSQAVGALARASVLDDQTIPLMIEHFNSEGGWSEAVATALGKVERVREAWLEPIQRGEILPVVVDGRRSEATLKLVGLVKAPNDRLKLAALLAAYQYDGFRPELLELQLRWVRDRNPAIAGLALKTLARQADLEKASGRMPDRDRRRVAKALRAAMRQGRGKADELDRAASSLLSGLPDRPLLGRAARCFASFLGARPRGRVRQVKVE